MPPPPPTRREQLQLDELLSDIYRGIETLPDKHQWNPSTSGSQFAHSSNKSLQSNLLNQAAYVYKEYELPASSPLVRHHKQQIEALRKGSAKDKAQQQEQQQQQHQHQQPTRSTLKRSTNSGTPEASGWSARQPVAYESSGGTPENRRRVRIVEHPEKLAKEQRQAAYLDESPRQQLYSPEQDARNNTKYVNTNKFIYHQEQNPDDDHDHHHHHSQLYNQEQVDAGENRLSAGSQEEEADNSEPDIDGVTRVEYYRTSWLDRQLGRASKRRSSKEQNERQVKEKAMIEELKRSLKNGAITLFKGKKNNPKNKTFSVYDDSFLIEPHEQQQHNKQSAVFNSGLATIPRRYQQPSQTNHNSTTYNTNTTRPTTDDNSAKLVESDKSETSGFIKNHHNNNYLNHHRSISHKERTATPKQIANSSTFNREAPKPLPSSTYLSNSSSQYPGAHPADSYSRTLPHNYQANKPHQLIQSHYIKTDKNYNTLYPSKPFNHQQQQYQIENMTHNYKSSANDCNTNGLPLVNRQQQQPKQQFDQQVHSQTQLGNTISSIPSPTEVVRSALSRSSSQISLNQLNKTSNMLLDSPTHNSAMMTPTKNLKAASPSLSPSPVEQRPSHYNHSQQHQQPSQHQNKSATIGSNYCQNIKQYNTHNFSNNKFNDKIQSPGHYGTTPAAHHSNSSSHCHQQQPVYANPHASLMQHKMEQQVRTSGSNSASIREFNELDSLLRSLSPGSVHITPGYSSKQAQPSFGYGPQGLTQSKQQPLAHNQGQTSFPRGQANTNSDLYAKVQKQPGDPFILDVTGRKEGECINKQELSEFEPPIELVPSMEDYQNISKLNPVKNHFWYKPSMSRDKAISLLKDKPQGTFIVRDSTSFRGAYGLAVKVSKLPKNIPRNPNAEDPSVELIRHFLIEPASNGVRLKGYANEPVFGSLPSLIYQHSLTELALPCKLLIPRADIEDPRFNQKQKQFVDDFIASREQAKHLPYERTSPDGGYRKYPGDVYVNNEHRIIFQ